MLASTREFDECPGAHDKTTADSAIPGTSAGHVKAHHPRHDGSEFLAWHWLRGHAATNRTLFSNSNSCMIEPDNARCHYACPATHGPAACSPKFFALFESSKSDTRSTSGQLASRCLGGHGKSEPTQAAPHLPEFIAGACANKPLCVAAAVCRGLFAAGA